MILHIQSREITSRSPWSVLSGRGERDWLWYGLFICQEIRLPPPKFGSQSSFTAFIMIYDHLFGCVFDQCLSVSPSLVELRERASVLFLLIPLLLPSAEPSAWLTVRVQVRCTRQTDQEKEDLPSAKPKAGAGK